MAQISAVGEKAVSSQETSVNQESNDEDRLAPQEVESLCMRCGENGITRLLLTTIPNFRELVVMAFDCPHCNERNNEVQFVGQLQPQGCRYKLTVTAGDSRVLNRQVVKSDSASITIPELEFEVPAEAQRGVLTTVEGVLTRAGEELRALQEERRRVDPETAARLDTFLEKLDSCATGRSSFSFVLDDPAGNSFVENPCAPQRDPLMTVEYYHRSPEQNAAMGFLAPETPPVAPTGSADTTGPKTDAPAAANRYLPAGTRPHGSVGAEGAHQAIAAEMSEAAAQRVFKYAAPEEVMTFPATCGACGARTETRMFVTNIPYFKEVIVMSSACEQCGYRNSELKAGGSIPPKGKKISAQILNSRDLTRDVIKSDTASVCIPEVELDLAPGTLGGRVTTVEGLVDCIQESLMRVNTFGLGDSALPSEKNLWVEFNEKLSALLTVERPWTLVLDDAMANSFIAPAADNFESDTQLTVEEYERTREQDEELGLLDMDTSAADVAYDQEAKGDQ